MNIRSETVYHTIHAQRNGSAHSSRNHTTPSFLQNSRESSPSNLFCNPSALEDDMLGDNLQINSWRPSTFISNDVRENLFKARKAKAAFMADAFTWYNLTDWHTVTELAAILPCSTTLIRQGLSHQSVFSSRPRATGKRGRPHIEYQLNDFASLQYHYGGHWHAANGTKYPPRIDHLPEWAFSSLRSYRLALHREFLMRNSAHGAEWFSASQSFMADRLGISPRTIRRYHQEIKPEVQEQLEITRLPRAEIAPDHSPGHTWIEVGSYTQIATRDPLKRMPFCRDAAQYALNRGWPLWTVRRRANKYRLGA